jgi:hypothetical protein
VRWYPGIERSPGPLFPGRRTATAMIGHTQQLRQARRLGLGEAARAGTVRALAHALRLVVIALAGSLLFVPLLAVGLLGRNSPGVGDATSVEAAVGIAVILRAAARRTLTAAIGGVMHTTLATAVRAGSRALLQRLVRTTILGILGVLALAAPRALGLRLGDDRRRRLNALAIGLGAAAMAVSCAGVLVGAGPDLPAEVGRPGVPPLFAAAALAPLPLLVYVASHAVTSRIWPVSVSYATPLDGVLLQAYFTGAGAFLPMATDIRTVGHPRHCMRAAAAGIGALFVLHLALLAVARSTDTVVPEFASAMALLYAFVFAFPVRPLPGSRVWRESRAVWLAVALPILASFYFLVPDALAVLV